MIKRIGIIAAIFTVLAGIWGAGSYIDARYAKAADQKATDQLLHDKLDSDHLRLLRERKWQMEKEFPVPAARPESVVKQIRDYEVQEKVLDQKLGGREVVQ